MKKYAAARTAAWNPAGSGNFLGRSFWRWALSLLPLSFILLPSAFSFPPPAPVPPPMNAAEIQLALQKLQVAGRVLYIAAHPDDENTTLISYWANGALYDTAYLSLTRGDGGQNLIGPELREALGVIRTQELLAARRIDHGQQFFTRANDFGFSKSSEETLSIWDREKILADVVWVIRKFQPDVIVTRFSADDKNTHGHHSASAQLANEAFKISGDATKFPEQLKYVQPSRAKRIFWNAWQGFRAGKPESSDGPKVLQEEVDSGYQPLLGRLYPEIAAQSRSMHKSQGFGVSANRNARPEFFVSTGSDMRDLPKQIFEHIETRWDRVFQPDHPYPLGLDEAISIWSEPLRDFRPTDPAASAPALLKLHGLLVQASNKAVETWHSNPEGVRAERKLPELASVIAACLGLHLTAYTDKSTAHPGEPMSVLIEAMCRSGGSMTKTPVKLVKLRFPVTDQTETIVSPLVNGQVLVQKFEPTLPAAMPYSQPYWLREPGTVGTYTVNDQTLIGLPENPPAFPVEATLDIGGQEITYLLNTRYRKVDPVEGEVTEPLVVATPVFVEVPRPVFVFGDAAAKSIDVRVEASSNTFEGQLVLEAPDGWQVEPAAAPVHLRGTGSAATITFKITPPADPKTSEGELRAVLVSADGKRTPAYGRQVIRYPHIDPQTLIPKAVSKLVRADIRNTGRRIGYVPGAGDAIPESLSEIGATVKTLTYDDLHAANLAQFDAVVFGVRAYNVQTARFTAAMAELKAYAEAGGVVIYQYNTLPGPGEGNSLPFPLHVSRERVTDETAAVTILAADHPLMTTPNRITPEDFNGWVQERGLYFPDKWDAAWTPLLSCHDPGENGLEGGLLAARCGKGYVVYTGYSWFRQLPAGVPGAYRLFANMISLGAPRK